LPDSALVPLQRDGLDPVAQLGEMRASEPVSQMKLPLGLRAWVVTGYAESKAVLGAASTFSSDFKHLVGTVGITADQDPGGLGFTDPPDHTRLRALVSQAFSPRMVDNLRTRVAEIVDGLLDAVIDAGQMDVIADVAYPLPTLVICELLGVPAGDREQFKIWSSDASRLLDGYLDQQAQTRGMVAGMQLFQYFNDLIGVRATEPRSDLLSALIQVRDNEESVDRLTNAELLTTVTLLFVAGFETTMNLVGNGMLALLRNPDQLARLRQDPTLLRTGVEEFLRYDSPVHVTARIATVDVEVNGLTIDAGHQVAVVIGAANRDPHAFEEPDRLDVGRSPNRHLSFGGGPHFCLGAALARIEGQAAFDAILRRLGPLELITTKPTHRDHFVIRGVNSLQVAFSPGAIQA
ncbi:MAG: cytochrome P450, partial [Pseudonocardiaceae bacterium]